MFAADAIREAARERCAAECRGENFVEVTRLYPDGRVECFCLPYRQWRN